MNVTPFWWLCLSCPPLPGESLMSWYAARQLSWAMRDGTDCVL